MSEILYQTLGETVQIETVLAAGVWAIFVDSNQLESALLNLAVTAAKDRLECGVRERLRTKCHRSPRAA
jgi:hypothetical protein